MHDPISYKAQTYADNLYLLRLSVHLSVCLIPAVYKYISFIYQQCYVISPWGEDGGG